MAEQVEPLITEIQEESDQLRENVNQIIADLQAVEQKAAQNAYKIQTTLDDRHNQIHRKVEQA